MKSFLIKRIIKKIENDRHKFFYDPLRDLIIEERPYGERDLWTGWVFLINHLGYVI